MDADAIQTSDAPAGAMFIVRVVTKNGTFSVAYNDAARALKAVGDFHEAGFSDVGVFDTQWRRLAYRDLEAAVPRGSISN